MCSDGVACGLERKVARVNTRWRGIGNDGLGSRWRRLSGGATFHLPSLFPIKRGESPHLGVFFSLFACSTSNRQSPEAVVRPSVRSNNHRSPKSSSKQSSLCLQVCLRISSSFSCLFRRVSRVCDCVLSLLSPSMSAEFYI